MERIKSIEAILDMIVVQGNKQLDWNEKVLLCLYQLELKVEKLEARLNK